jgi:leucyl-tRNA synthetase
MTEQREERSTYDIQAAQDKWMTVWQELDPFRRLDDGSRERRYMLDMFTYPSGDLHM